MRTHLIHKVYLFYRDQTDKKYEWLPSLARGRSFSSDYSILDEERFLIKTEKYINGFTRKCCSASVSAFASVIDFIIMIIVAFNLYRSIREIQRVTNTIGDMNDSIVAMNIVLSTYYDSITGEGTLTIIMNLKLSC